jgi:hypothetical protein
MAQNKNPLQQRLANLKKTLDCDPTNVEAANRYWDALGSFGGHNVRSGGFVREAFRGCALDSPEGVVAFVRAYRELFESTGEKPRPELFDEELLLALRSRVPELSDEDRAKLDWILTSIK